MNRLTQAIVSHVRKTLDMHIVETGGVNRGPEIDAWNFRVSSPKGMPWCAAAAWGIVQDACNEVGVENPIHPTGSVHHMWEATPERCRVLYPAPGVICLHDSGKGKGHAGIVVSIVVGPNGTWIAAGEGNTNKQGSREGNAFLLKSRSAAYWNLGFLDPSVDAVPLTSEVPE